MRRAAGAAADELGLRGRRRPAIGQELAADLARLRPPAGFSLIFDVGANTGQTARRFARMAPQAEIVSFEPIESSYRLLVENARDLPRVRPVHSAVGERCGEVTFELKEVSRWNSLVPELNRPERGVGVAERTPMVTVDAFCDEQGYAGMDLLKSDTEGWDLQVLKGARNLLSSGELAFVLVEVSFEPEDPGHSSFQEVAAYLRGFDFRFLALYDVAWEAGPWRVSFANALFTSL